MYINTIKIKLYWIVPLVLATAVLLFLSPQADASIVVDGDTKFTDDVNECLDTYKNVPGIVSDVIRELENSDNEHRITNSPDWSNTVNDADDAFDGTGTGTVTRVDKKELETYKESFEELENKDFCTALLHELWHAVDADRGEWTTDELGGVKRNEIEATIFQNFVHAIRGVDPRTAYGGTDISDYVLIGEDRTEEIIEEPEPEPESEPKTETSISTSYNHVAPGVYSEVYATVMASPGSTVQATLTGPGVSGPPTQTVIADGEGVARFTWRIVSYGNYTVSGIAGGNSFSSGVSVQ